LPVSRRRFAPSTSSWPKRVLHERDQVIPCYSGLGQRPRCPNGDLLELLHSRRTSRQSAPSGYDLMPLWKGQAMAQLRDSIKRKECACPMANANYANMLLRPDCRQGHAGCDDLRLALPALPRHNLCRLTASLAGVCWNRGEGCLRWGGADWRCSAVLWSIWLGLCSARLAWEAGLLGCATPGWLWLVPLALLRWPRCSTGCTRRRRWRCAGRPAAGFVVPGPSLTRRRWERPCCCAALCSAALRSSPLSPCWDAADLAL
jgi:hypothetical protein